MKIGKTVDIKSRMSNLQSGCPFKLFLWLAIRTFESDEIEKYLLDALSDFNIRGEWFVLDGESLDFLVSFFAKKNLETRWRINALL